MMDCQSSSGPRTIEDFSEIGVSIPEVNGARVSPNESTLKKMRKKRFFNPVKKDTDLFSNLTLVVAAARTALL